MMRKLFFIFIVLPMMLLAQEEKNATVWQSFHFFVGTWVGDGAGCPGFSKVEAEFNFIFKGNFLEVKGISVFKPQEKNPQGEVHEDWGLISYDRNRQKFVFRQFHVEGFVNQYLLDSLSADGTTFVFQSESIENIPTGWRARVTYRRLNDNELAVVFELAQPGKEFQIYSNNRLTRKK